MLSSKVASRSALRASSVFGSQLRFFSTTDKQDIVVIGGGPGGYVAAIKAAQLGFKVTCVEKRGTLGGTCLNVGCIPSKALLNSSHMFAEACHSFSKHGIEVSGVKVNLEKMMDQKKKAVSGLTNGIAGLFKKNKVNYEIGCGRITSPNEVTVDLNAGGSKTIAADKIIIATGSDVMSIPGVEIDEQRVVSSTGALSLSAIPKRLLVIGGGVIGLEMGSVWRRLGAEVIVIEYQDKIISTMDHELGKVFQRTLEKQGFQFKLGTKVVKCDKSGPEVALTVQPAAGGPSEVLTGDVVLVSTGRRRFTDNLGLEKVGVKVEKGVVQINDHFQTSVPSIYAIGDVVRGAMLAHKAEEEGIACVEMLAGKGGHVNYDTVPSVIYTHPEVASVGKTEEELKAANIKYRVGKFPFMANSRARTVDDADGIVKILADASTDKVLGIHIVGSNAGEMIAEGVLAMEYGASSEDIARTCHAHPTLSEAFKEAAMSTYDKPIHF